MQDSGLDRKREELERQKADIISNIDRLRGDLERVDFALRVLNAPDLFAGRKGVPILEVTPNGTIKGLAEGIETLLDSKGVAMTASQMADLLYTYRMPMTVEQMRRRISVTTSALFKTHNPPPLVDSKWRNDRREIYWALPAWMEAGELLRKYEPIEGYHMDEKQKPLG